MSKRFASQDDLAEKKVTFSELADGVYAYTTEGDPNSGVVVGDDAVMVIEAQATPVMAQGVIDQIRAVTNKPIRHLVLSHYHAVRVLGASAYGDVNIMASQATYDLIAERGQQDFESEVQRFPRLFRSVETVPGLTWPTIVFDQRLTVWMGKRRVEILHLGRAHTKGDVVVWLPRERIAFSGDLVEYQATPYTGDAYLRDWPRTLDQLGALHPRKIVPGRGGALTTSEQVEAGISGTRTFVSELFDEAGKGVQQGRSLAEVYQSAYARLHPQFGHWVIFDHCLPFDVARAYDEARGIDDPAIWTAERDLAMWHELEGALDGS